jgi:hypothetical protein
MTDDEWCHLAKFASSWFSYSKDVERECTWVEPCAIGEEAVYADSAPLGSLGIKEGGAPNLAAGLPPAWLRQALLKLTAEIGATWGRR